jgi:hypothetical protein
MMKPTLFTLTALIISTLPAPLMAEERVLTIYGQDSCPANTICVTRPESERYRIPKELRPASAKPANQSWAVRSQGTINTGSSAPSESCGQAGTASSWGGCWLQEMRKARADAKAAKEEGAALP